jgi:hypothetical protein
MTASNPFRHYMLSERFLPDGCWDTPFGKGGRGVFMEDTMRLRRVVRRTGGRNPLRSPFAKGGEQGTCLCAGRFTHGNFGRTSRREALATQPSDCKEEGT